MGTIRAVLWDFGGVITTSPFDAFAEYERTNGLPPGFIRGLNATNHHDNAWARFERSEIGVEEFCRLFEAEAEAQGGRLVALEVLAGLRGEIRPAMAEAVRRCHERLKNGLVTNNFLPPPSDARPEGEDLYSRVLHHFDAVVESSKVGVRKPDPRFYEMACEMLGVAPEEAVFLDDLGVNLKPARDMGITTIKVVDPDRALAELEAVVGFSLRN